MPGRAVPVVLPSAPTWRDGNHIVLLRNGGEYFPALFDAIDAARRSVHLETYIFRLDRTGLALLRRLQRARARGVRVRVVIDGFGSQAQADELVRRLTAMGARCRVYRPEPRSWREHRLDTGRLRRLHRKMALVDGAVAFVGGINVLDDYEDVPDDGLGPQPRFDFAVRLQGPIVRDVSRTMWLLWLRMAWRRRDDWAAFYRRVLRWRQARQRHWPSARTYDPGQRAVLLLRDNLRFRQTIERHYLQVLGEAQHDVIIANAYFFPARRLRKALKAAVARGVRVRLLLQGRAEYPVQHRASRYMYDALLRAGVEIYEYMPSYLHAKVAVMDDGAMVGSANLDPFSLLLAREANVYVEDPAFAAGLRADLVRAIEHDAEPMTVEHWGRRRLWERVADTVAYLLLRVGVVITGRDTEY